MRKKENVEGSAGGALSAAGLKHVVQEAGDISGVGDRDVKALGGSVHHLEQLGGGVVLFQVTGLAIGQVQEQIAAERMKQMLRFVEEHYAEELTVERIAASVALSESACLRSFRQMLGITPIQYVKQFRVEKAAELLRSTRLKTGEIGMECGFADGSYFIKTFREIKHCTPKEYRAKFC